MQRIKTPLKPRIFTGDDYIGSAPISHVFVRICCYSNSFGYIYISETSFITKEWKNARNAPHYIYHAFCGSVPRARLRF